MRILELAATNYRTLEQVTLSFTGSFSAICGPNDAGKTNVIRALRAVLRDEPAGYFLFYDPHDLSSKSDWPKWKKDADAGVIELKVTLRIAEDADTGLYRFLERQLSLDDPPAEISLELTLTLERNQPNPEVSVAVLGKHYVDLDAQEVLSKLQASTTLLLHNSTSLPYSGSIGRLRELPADQEQVAKVQGILERELKKVAKARQEGLEKLLGSLGGKYKVGFTLPTVDVTDMPFNITLEESKASVPLDDWGSGTRNRTLILLKLFAAREVAAMPAAADKVTPVLIIEEPECFLHPIAQAQFGRALQALAADLGVQVIVTTHSPYLLSTDDPDANILLKRRVRYKRPVDTQVIDTSGEKWMDPFAEALGLKSAAFDAWEPLFAVSKGSVLLVEGETDKKYLKLLRDPAHGSKALAFEGEIVPYEGTGQLSNAVLLRLLRNRCETLIVTYDLDARDGVLRHLENAGLSGAEYQVTVGVDKPGNRSMEGLLPSEIKETVHAARPDLVEALQSDVGSERKNAKAELKRQYLQEFERVAKPGDEHYGELYKLAKAIDRAVARQAT